MVSFKKPNGKRILGIIITVIFVFCAVSMVATKIIYDSVFVRYDTPAQVPAALLEMVQQRHTCQFASGKNLLTGYFYGTTAPENAHGLVVLVPGFSAGGDDYLQQIRAFTDYGWGVFTFDNTGTLRSQGESQVGFSQSLADLEAALKYVENCDRFGYNELVLVGHSRGAYAACCVLSRHEDIRAVVSVSGVNSAMDAIMQLSSQYVGPVSYGNYGFLWLYQAMLFGSDTLQLQASDVIARQDVPVLVVHGTQDTRIPVDAGSIIAHRDDLDASRAEFLLWDGGHTDLLYDPDGTANDALMAQIHAFLLRSITP